MVKIRNSDILKQVLLTLIMITGRRSSNTIACAFMNAIIETLKEKYDFMKSIIIKDITYFEGTPANAIHIKTNIESITSEEFGEAIESIIRILCMDLEEETGLFFIKELKDRLSDRYLSELKKRGVDLELLKLEQRHLHETLEKRKSLIDHEADSEILDMSTNVLNYTWDAVASFKYRNNICFLYDKDGKLLDKLHLNKIIEYYIRTLTDFGKLVEKSDQIEITEKQYEFLQMLYARDLDAESAIFLLRMPEGEFTRMVQQLLRYEMLRHVSHDEIKLTEKGIKILEEKKKKTEEAIAQ